MTVPIDVILRIAQVVLGFTLLLLFHEIGHLIVGILVGVKVERLSIGFGPKLFGFKRRETEYVISAVPAGGYVKFKGDEPGSPESREPDSFWGKAPGPRALIVIGGVFMNIVTGVIAFAIAFGIGVKTESPVVGSVLPHGPAEAAGFLPGDRILSINGRKVADFQDVAYGVAMGARGEPLAVDVQRNGSHATFDVVPEFDDARGIQTIGILPAASLTVGALTKGSAAENAGLRAGDEILSVDGRPIESWEQFEQLVKSNPGETLAITVRRKGGTVDLAVAVEPVYEWILGVEGFPLVQKVLPGSAADQAGILEGDILLAFDNTEVVGDLLPELLAHGEGNPARLSVLRGGRQLHLTVTPARSGDRWLLGIVYVPATLVARVHEGSPAEELGIVPGDHIVSIEGKRVTSLNEAAVVLQDRKDAATRIQWARQQEVISSQFIPEKSDAPATGILGVVPEAQSEVIRQGFIGACKLGVLRSILTAKRAGMMFWALLTRQVSPTNVGGPVLIGRVLYQRAGQGLARLIYFFGMISVLIAIPNLLPLPVLDGGHLVILAVEKLKGSPLSTRAMMVWQYSGIVLIAVIFVLILVNDIHQLFTLTF